MHGRLLSRRDFQTLRAMRIFSGIWGKVAVLLVGRTLICLAINICFD